MHKVSRDMRRILLFDILNKAVKRENNKKTSEAENCKQEMNFLKQYCQNKLF